MPASPPSSGVRVSAAVAPCTRDPRTRTDLPVDPRLQSSASFHQTAVVLPTQAKPSTITAQPDSATQAEQTARSGPAENIFDRLKDLIPVKSESVRTPHVANSQTCSTAPAESKTGNDSAFSVESCASKDPHIVYPETDAIRKSTASPRPDDRCFDSKSKSEEMQLNSSLLRASSLSPKQNRSDTEHSGTVYDKTDQSSCPQAINRNTDLQSRCSDGPKSGRRRASSQDREKPRGNGKWTTGPVAKKMRRERQHDELKNVDSSESLPVDIT